MKKIFVFSEGESLTSKYIAILLQQKLLWVNSKTGYYTFQWTKGIDYENGNLLI